jgi:hypothetical protein
MTRFYLIQIIAHSSEPANGLMVVQKVKDYPGIDSILQGKITVSAGICGGMLASRGGLRPAAYSWSKVVTSSCKNPHAKSPQGCSNAAFPVGRTRGSLSTVMF